MEFQRIKTLIDRYFAGESTLPEEKILRDYFAGKEVDERLKQHAPLFQWASLEQEQAIDEQKFREMIHGLPGTSAPRVPLRSRRLYWMAKVAAVLVLAVGIWWAYQTRQETDQTAAVDWSKYEITDEKQALEITRGALFKASKTLNEGAGTAAEQMDRMQELGKFFK